MASWEPSQPHVAALVDRGDARARQPGFSQKFRRTEESIVTARVNKVRTVELLLAAANESSECNESGDESIECRADAMSQSSQCYCGQEHTPIEWIVDYTRWGDDNAIIQAIQMNKKESARRLLQANPELFDLFVVGECDGMRVEHTLMEFAARVKCAHNNVAIVEMMKELREELRQ